MTLSVWRNAHLALALISSLFLVFASITGTVLAVDAICQKVSAYRVPDLDDINLSETLPVLRKVYPEISELLVDHNGSVTLRAINSEGNEVFAYIDPRTGKVMGYPEKENAFIQWVTAFHRSLFLHETGRALIGITAFLLSLITISGIGLIIQRQQGWRRFFSRIVKDYFAQYYHVVLGRLSLIPMLIIALSGTYLAMVRFNFFPEQKTDHHIVTAEQEVAIKKELEDFPIFKTTRLSGVQKIQFPFIADDPEEYFILKLKDRELVVSQFTGALLSDIPYPRTKVLSTLSLNLHTGRTSMIWAGVLAVASANVLFFIYSGFSITCRRRSTSIKNPYTALTGKYILLVGSENGNTLSFANIVHQQLLARGLSSYLIELNGYTVFPEAEYIVIFTSTYGLGNAPSNANKLAERIAKYPQQKPVHVSVVGFGSRAYPDFCAFAFEAEKIFLRQSWAIPLLPLHTVNDKSADQFIYWLAAWTGRTGISIKAALSLFRNKVRGLQSMIVLEKTKACPQDHTFIVKLRPLSKTRFASGDLLAIYPGNGVERFYSIGKIGSNIQLIVKLHSDGLGSGFLYNLKPGRLIRSRIAVNPTFHFPEKKSAVVMIANGTGIAPFLGMIAGNKKEMPCHLYCGFRRETDVVSNFRKEADQYILKNRLKGFHVALSREQNCCYVTDLVRRDAILFANILITGGVIMICGSLAMQRDVETALDSICWERNGKPLVFFKDCGQLLTDCY